jgi:phosphoribosylaminoimidazole (AIR) synthetase
VEEAEMDRVFHRGVGMALVVQADRAAEALDVLAGAGHPSTVIGHVAARAPGGPGVVIA